MLSVFSGPPPQSWDNWNSFGSTTFVLKFATNAHFGKDPTHAIRSVGDND